MNPCAVLFHFEQDERTRKIRRWLARRKIEVITAEAGDYLQSIGFLARQPGFSRVPSFYMGSGLTDEMIVLSEIPDETLDEFLQFFRTENLAPIARKAVLTPVNAHWSALRLFEELSREL